MIVAVSYRRSPEHAIGATVADAVDAHARCLGIGAHPARVAFAGYSAGVALCALALCATIDIYPAKTDAPAVGSAPKFKFNVDKFPVHDHA